MSSAWWVNARPRLPSTDLEVEIWVEIAISLPTSAGSAPSTSLLTTQPRPDRRSLAGARLARSEDGLSLALGFEQLAPLRGLPEEIVPGNGPDPKNPLLRRGCGYASSSLESRCRIPLSRASTGAFATRSKNGLYGPKKPPLSVLKFQSCVALIAGKGHTYLQSVCPIGCTVSSYLT